MPKASKYATVTVFKSFVDVVEVTSRNDSEKGKLYSAYMLYSLYGTEPNGLSDHLAALFELVKPNINVSNKRREARSTPKNKTGDKTGDKTGTKPEQESEVCPGFALHREEEEEEEVKKEKNIKKENFANLLTEEEATQFRRWLEIWEYNHGAGKPMNALQQENQLRRLIALPAEIRLEALTAAGDGGWKQIHDPRNGTNGGGKKFDPADPETWEK